MENNLFYSRGNCKNKNTNKNKLDFKQKKENTLTSLNEVENFLINYKHFIKYVKLYKLFRN
mgnify:FL=1